MVRVQYLPLIKYHVCTLQRQTVSTSQSDLNSDRYFIHRNNFLTQVKTKGGKYGTNEVADNTETEKSNEDKPTETPAPPPEDVWSQAQQKALESSLTQFPKGTTERWERIANKVPGKTKEQCIQRFKTLAEMVKKKKLEGESAS